MTSFDYVQVNAFQPNVDGWNLIGNVSWKQQDNNTILLTNENSYQIKIYFLSPTVIRVRFNPVVNPNYAKDISHAVVNYNLEPVSITVQEVDINGNTLVINTGILELRIGLEPYGIAVYKEGKLITEDTYGKNIVFSNQAVANLKKSPLNEQYFGFGEKAGTQLNMKNYTLSFFNYDNFTYNDLTFDGKLVVPENNQGGPLNPSGPLYNSMPFLLAVGQPQNQKQSITYSYGILLDNVSQSYFNLGANDYSYMTGKYYFGALYGELDYYIIIGTENSRSAGVVADVLNQLTMLTGRSAMAPKYALGYHQGCYGYWNKEKLLDAAKSYRKAGVPIDGLHIDVDFQNNYRTFTISPNKFPDPKGMFDELHEMGFKCSANITGIISANPLDEDGKDTTPYPTRDELINLNSQDATQSTYKDNAAVKPFIYNTRFESGVSPEIFLANESYGVNNGVNINPYNYPTPSNRTGNDQLGTYGFYCNMGDPAVQTWWGKQYNYVLKQGLDMIWQDMTCPAVVPNNDNHCEDKTLPLDLMMYDKCTDQYQPNAAVHNAFAINLIEATYKGITKLKAGDDYKNLYNYEKRNFIIARGGYTGVHRYAGIWTGDSASSWDFLTINIPEVLNIGLSGQPVSGCDIGGFANGSGSVDIQINNTFAKGITNPELYVRWMNCGAFLPWFRNHYDGYTKSFQEPYNYGQEILAYCKTCIEIRYKLIQVFYDAMYECTQNGMPIARALFLNENADPEVFNHLNDEFFIGKDILVAPVVTPNTYNRQVYLPADSNWYVLDVNNGPLAKPTPGGTTYNWYVPLGLVPVYVREGAILPLKQLEQYIGELKNNPITFTIYPGKDNEYQLYQDDEVSTAFEVKGAYRVTQISTKSVANKRQIIFNRTYDNFAPDEKYFFVCLPDYTTAPQSVFAANKPLQLLASRQALDNSIANAYIYDENNGNVLIKINDDQSYLSIEVTNN